MVLKNKKPKSRHNNNVGVGEDKISNLPDELIHHILSFLPTKSVMFTCILSKRWKYVSNSIPTLDFSEWRPVLMIGEEQIRLKSQQFMNFLDMVLYLHEKPNIQKFYLTLDTIFDESRVNKWISIVIKRKVEELFLSSVFLTSLIFPLSFFTCDSLTVLELDNIRLDVPDTISFPRMKSLRLKYMKFVKEIAIEKLVSNCPILEELTLIHGLCFKCEVLRIENLALKNLCIGFDYIRESTVKICAHNLSTFSYGSEVPTDFVFDRFPSQVEADIDLYCSGAYTFETSVITKLFEKLSNVKLLKMCGKTFSVLMEAEIHLTDFPAFNNLTHLEVSSNFDCTNFGYSVPPTGILFRFLQLSPYLESIVFDEGIYCCDGEDNDSWSVDAECSLQHLKSVEFKDFDGEPVELDAIKLFLKYAGVLETMTIVASPSLSRNYEAQTKAMRQLLLFPKPINCGVKFLLNVENT